MVTCQVELETGALRLACSKGDGATSAVGGGDGDGGQLVATGRVTRVLAPPAPAPSQPPQGLQQHAGEAEAAPAAAAASPRNRTLRMLATLLGVASLAAAQQQQQHISSGTPPPASSAVARAPSLGCLAPAPGSAGGTAGGTAGSTGGTGAWYTSGFLSFPGHLDSALHLGVALPGSGAKVGTGRADWYALLGVRG